jgi:hypothetical protein
MTFNPKIEIETAEIFWCVVYSLVFSQKDDWRLNTIRFPTGLITPLRRTKYLPSTLLGVYIVEILRSKSLGYVNIPTGLLFVVQRPISCKDFWICLHTCLRSCLSNLSIVQRPNSEVYIIGMPKERGVGNSVGSLKMSKITISVFFGPFWIAF